MGMDSVGVEICPVPLTRPIAVNAGLMLPAFSPDQSVLNFLSGWLGSRVVSVLDSGAEGPGFKSLPRSCRVTVLGELFTHIVPLFTKQRNW